MNISEALKTLTKRAHAIRVVKVGQVFSLKVRLTPTGDWIRVGEQLDLEAGLTALVAKLNHEGPSDAKVTKTAA